MKKRIQVGLLLILLLAPTTVFGAAHTRRAVATCTGSTPCRACKNCKYCKHCAKEGGKCGVCRRRAEGVIKRRGSWEGATEKLTSNSTSRTKRYPGRTPFSAEYRETFSMQFALRRGI